MGISDFYIRVVRVLDEIGAPYMIVGAFGGYPFGITRITVVEQNMLLHEIEETMLFRDAFYKLIAKAERISRHAATKIPL